VYNDILEEKYEANYTSVYHTGLLDLYFTLPLFILVAVYGISLNVDYLTGALYLSIIRIFHLEAD